VFAINQIKMGAESWKGVEKERTTAIVDVLAMERLKWERYKTGKSVGQILSELIHENLEEVPPEFLKSRAKAKKRKAEEKARKKAEKEADKG